MWAYFIMPTYNSTTGGPMGMFNDKDGKFKRLEKIILEIINLSSLLDLAYLVVRALLTRYAYLSLFG